MFSMGLWTLGFYDSISFMSVNLPLASSPALLKSDHGCPLLWSILTYFTYFFAAWSYPANVLELGLYARLRVGQESGV